MRFGSPFDSIRVAVNLRTIFLLFPLGDLPTIYRLHFGACGPAKTLEALDAASAAPPPPALLVASTNFECFTPLQRPASISRRLLICISRCVVCNTPAFHTRDPYTHNMHPPAAKLRLVLLLFFFFLPGSFAPCVCCLTPTVASRPFKPRRNRRQRSGVPTRCSSLASAPRAKPPPNSRTGARSAWGRTTCRACSPVAR